MLCIHLMDSLDGFASVRRCEDLIAHVDAFYDEHLVFKLHFASDISGQPAIACVDLARFQRTCECAGQSAARGRNHVIECSCVRFKRIRA